MSFEKCIKVDNGIECLNCNYPYSAALYQDNYDHTNGAIPCDASEEEILAHIKDIARLRSDRKEHPYDCKCLIHR